MHKVFKTLVVLVSMFTGMAKAELVIGADGSLNYSEKRGTAGFKLATRGNDAPEIGTFSVERVGDYVAYFEYVNTGGDGWLTTFPIGKIEAGNKVTLFEGFAWEANGKVPVVSWKNTTYPSGSDFAINKLNAQGNRLLLLDHMIAHAMTEYQFAQNAGRDAVRYQQLSPSRFLESYLQWREVIVDVPIRAEFDLLVVTRFAEAGMRDFVVEREIQSASGMNLAKLALNPIVAERLSNEVKTELKKFVDSILVAAESQDFMVKSRATRVIEQNRETLTRLEAVLTGKPDPAPNSGENEGKGCGLLGRLFGSWR